MSTAATVVEAVQVGLTLVTPTLVFGVIVHAGRIAGVLAALARRLRLFPDPVPVPAEPPIEQVAASLRRVGRELASLPPGAPQVRRRALLLAYDDLLQVACRELAVRHDLGKALSRWDREVERLRVEVCLQEAGLQIRDRHGRVA